MDDAAYKDGFNAFDHGLDRTDCPYDYSCLEGRYWIAGWQDAEREYAEDYEYYHSYEDEW